jgi:glycosyltransferase involved in cell wall biosynthesis
MDGRKNWEDLITGFLFALREQDDATLVIKLISKSPADVQVVLSYYRRLDLQHRCKVVVISDFLPEEQMMALTAASTYYITATRAEGNCLPLMNYLAAGRPGVSPSHTAVSDYFGSDVGYVVDSHPEPAAWPQDPQFRCRATWHRLVWPSLVEQIRKSYWVAKYKRAAYEARAACACEKMADLASMKSVWPKLQSALDMVVGSQPACRGAPSRRMAA